VTESQRPSDGTAQSADQESAAGPTGTPGSFLGVLKEQGAQEVAQLRRRVEELLEPYDAFDFLANLFFANSVIDANCYRESTFEGLSAVVEYAARDLIRRASRQGSSGNRLINGPAVEACQEAIRLLLRWGSFARLNLAAPDEVTDEHLRNAVLNKRLFLRHPSFEHQERRVLEELFGGDFSQTMREVVGFTVADAQAVTDAFRTLPLDRLAERAAQAKLMVVQAKTKGRASEDPNKLEKQFRKLPASYRNAAVALVWEASGDAVALTVEDISVATGLQVETVSCFLTSFRLGFGLTLEPGVDWVEGFLAGYNPLLRRPIIDDGNGNYLCIGPGLLFFALRGAFEEALKPTDWWETYNRRRKTFQESEVGRLLTQALRPDIALVNVSYKVDPEVFELDALVTLGSIAIIAEAKGKLLSEPARRGAPAALSRDLGDIITAGTNQAERVRRLIERDGGLRLVQADGSEQWLDLSVVESVIPMVVALEDLSSIASHAEPLVEAGLITNGSVPLLLSLHDLEIVCDLVGLPAQLVHYFLRRYEVNRLRLVAAVDELDYLMYYLLRGLYFENMLQGPDAPNGIFIGSLTDEIDAYYYYKHGIRSKPAEKPRQEMPRRFRRVLEQLDQGRPVGWLKASLALLDMDGYSRDQFAEWLAGLGWESDRDGKFHDRTLIFGNDGVTLMSAPRDRAHQLTRRLHDYCHAKRYQQHAQTWTGFGLVHGRGEAFTDFMHVSEPFKPAADLERLVQELGLARP